MVPRPHAVLHPTVEAASAAVDTAVDVITNCPRDDGDDYGWVEHTGIDYYVGDQSLAGWTATGAPGWTGSTRA